MKTLLILIALSILSFFVPVAFGDAWFAPLLLLTLAAGLVYSFGTVAGAILYTIVAIVGTSFDIAVGELSFVTDTLANLGSRTFTHSDFLGVPAWVPFMYGNTSLIVLHFYSLINKALDERTL